MLLPANLNAFHHLVFTFYHINAEQKKGFDAMEVCLISLSLSLCLLLVGSLTFTFT
jgi:hypothetical protein